MTAHLAGVCHLADAECAREQIFTHTSVVDAGLAVIEGDSRCLAEIHVVNLGYADLLLLAGDPAALGGEIIEHLRRP